MDHPNERITVLLVDDDAEHNDNMQKLLSFEAEFQWVGSATSGEHAIRLASELEPDIILMDINMPGMDGFETTRSILEMLPSASIIMMSVQQEVSYLREAMSVGVREYLAKPVLPETLYETIRKVHANKLPITAPLRPLPPDEVLEKRRQAETIVVYSPSGGTGTTTLAINLASGLMREDVKVLLVDADMQFGDIRVVLNLPPEPTVMDLLASPYDLDPEFFENITVTHPSGLKVLTSPRNIENTITLHEDHVLLVNILESVQKLYDYIVIDTGSFLTDLNLDLFSMASRVVLVATPVLEVIKNIGTTIQLMEDRGIASDQMMLVLNRIPMDQKLRRQTVIPSKRIETYLQRSVDMHLPLDEVFVRASVSRGVPLLAYDRNQRQPLTRMFVDLADRVHAKKAETNSLF